MDRESCQRLSANARKCRTLFLLPQVTEQVLQDPRGSRPKRNRSIFPTFPMQLNVGLAAEDNVTLTKAGYLRDASTQVIHREQQGVVAPPTPVCTIYGSQDGLHLFPCQILAHSGISSFQRDRQHASCDADARRITQGDHAIERAYRGEPQVARHDGVAAVFFQSVEESEDDLGVKFWDLQSSRFDAGIAMNELQQQSECIAITRNGL